MRSARGSVVALVALAACHGQQAANVHPEPAATAPALTPAQVPAPEVAQGASPAAAPSAAREPEATSAVQTSPPSDAFDPFAWPPGHTPPEVWEQRTVTVGGVAETWILRWRKPPRFNGCTPSISCACAGVEWGLQGDLELWRERPGAPTERLDLGKMRDGGAQIPGFSQTSFDVEKYDQELADIVKRPHVQVMNLRDYDHDGWATEFVFEVGYWACGQNPSVLVGVSRVNPHLYVFDTTGEQGRTRSDQRLMVGASYGRERSGGWRASAPSGSSPPFDARHRRAASSRRSPSGATGHARSSSFR